VILDNQPVDAINTALRPSTIAVADVPVLPANRARAFQGFLPGAKFDITIQQAEQLLARSDAAYERVVLPYLDGRDITRTVDQRPRRYTIDFAQMALEEAMRYPAALEIVRAQAKEARETSTSYERNPRWWQFLWPRPAFRTAVAALPRFIAGGATAKRVVFVWCEKHWRPSNSTNMFALATDYAMGVLASRIHLDWATSESSTMRVDPRYTPSSAFDTYPWPQPTDTQRTAIGALSRELIQRRRDLCAEHDVGLQTLYNRLEDGAFGAFRQLHERLDLAVLAAYGWPRELIDDAVERNARLYDLNQRILTGDLSNYQPF
jgi:hypothetical protein